MAMAMLYLTTFHFHSQLKSPLWAYWNEVSFVENLQSKNENCIESYKFVKTQIKQKGVKKP